MTIGSKYQAWLRASLHTATFAGLILIAACWLVAAFVSSVEHEQAIEGMVKQSDGMVRLFEEYTVEIIERIDRTLLLLRKSYEDDPGHFDLRSWASRTELVGDETIQVTLIGADGYQVASTTDYRGPPPYLGDRKHFRAHLDPAVDRLFISEPVVGRVSGKVSLQFTRRIRAAGGGFGGVFVISIHPDFIAPFYRAVDHGENGSVVLRNLDGVILAAQGLSTDAIGRRIKPQPLLEALARSGSGHYWGGGAIDGSNRLVAYRSSGRFPLIFTVGLAEKDGLSGYLKHRTTYFTAAAIISLIVLIAMVFIVRHQAKLEESQASLRLLNGEISEQNVRFDAALANMSNGLSMFDADGRLMIWNDRYVEIYGMAPEIVRQGVSIYTIVEHRKAAGNLSHDVDAYVGEFRQQLIDSGKSSSSSRLSDGRTISVVNTAIEGGGWVGIHEDITERIEDETSIFRQATELALVNMRFDAALSNMTQGVCLFDADKNLVIANRRFREMYGFPEELVVPGTPLSSMLRHFARQGVKSDLTVEQHAQRIPTELDQDFSTIDGRVISIKRAPTPDGGWVATHEDVTERKRQEDLIAEKAVELERINMQFDAALSNISQGISMFDRHRRLVVWNDRYAELYRLPRSRLKAGTDLRDIIAEIAVRNALEGEMAQEAIDGEIANMMSEFPADSQSSVIKKFADGRLILIARQPLKEGGWVATHEDITERKRAEAEIAHMARHDALTGLANRAEFNARLAEVSQRAERYGSAVTVLMLDLDKFKAVNDTLGHPAGDQLLVEVGQRLHSALRETDVLARLGGDEFAIIQEGGSHQRDSAIALAQRIIQVIAQPFDLHGHPAHIGSSIGIAMAPEHGVDPEQLLTAADLALYDAKASGRNDFRVFRASMLEVARTRKSAEGELRDAIERQEFELHYQPVVDVKRHLLCGVEALVRWRHPARGLVAPDQFIPLAESTGLIAPLGEWILLQACADAASLPEHIKVAVNVSAMQFRKGNLFDIVCRILAKTGLSPERIELEVTETSHLENQDAHLATMRKLKNLGISMVLDDFGTGYSSINYLTSFPFDKIKIDKSFTQGALDRSDCAAVIASTLALAQGLGIVTTAEGVETEPQFEHMRNAGVDLVQGYLFGRPVPIAEFGPQTALTLEMLCRVAKSRTDMAQRKRVSSKLRA
jgi:diguanylate cyclase (GGDEF)-like protein/PAS domain S-box-containing protein